MLPHAKIVVGTPNDDVTRTSRGMPDRPREPAGQPLEVGKYAIALLIPQTGQSIREKPIVIHGPFPGTQRLLIGTLSG
jgi:hypothetical protein